MIERALEQPAAPIHAHLEQWLDRIHAAIQIKARIVEADEREAGERALLNLGHTFGHALEASAGFGEWSHGEAVCVGMVAAAHVSVAAGIAPGTSLTGGYPVGDNGFAHAIPPVTGWEKRFSLTKKGEERRFDLYVWKMLENPVSRK